MLKAITRNSRPCRLPVSLLRTMPIIGKCALLIRKTFSGCLGTEKRLFALSFLVFLGGANCEPYIQGGADLIKTFGKGGHSIAYQFSYWDLKDIKSDLRGYGITFTNEIGPENKEYGLRYDQLLFSGNGDFDLIPLKLWTSGGSIGPVLSVDKDSDKKAIYGLTANVWSYFGIVGGCSIGYKGYLGKEDAVTLSLFYRVGLPLRYVFPVVH
jgi:hypothetical protein